MSSILTRPRRPHSMHNNRAFTMPRWAANSLADFRKWYASDDFPEDGRISYLAGEIFFDMSHERLSSHVSLKGELARILISLAEELNLGQFFTDGARVVNELADVSNEPDGCYVTWDSVKKGRVRLQPSADGNDSTEIVGSPELVIEILSPSTVKKDTSELPKLYWRAGISEYWLVDALEDEIDFEVFARGATEYEAVGSADGWQRSPTFGREFRIERYRNPIGIWQYRLQVRKPNE